MSARAVRVSLRTAHLLAFGALYGGSVFSVPAEPLRQALAWTVATGAALMAFEIWRSPAFAVQVRGLSALVKIAFAVALSLQEPMGLPLLTLAAVIGAVSSHMPGRYRYHSLLPGVAAGPQEKG